MVPSAWLTQADGPMVPSAWLTQADGPMVPSAWLTQADGPMIPSVRQLTVLASRHFFTPVSVNFAKFVLLFLYFIFAAVVSTF